MKRLLGKVAIKRGAANGMGKAIKVLEQAAEKAGKENATRRELIKARSPEIQRARATRPPRRGAHAQNARRHAQADVGPLLVPGHRRVEDVPNSLVCPPPVRRCCSSSTEGRKRSEGHALKKNENAEAHRLGALR